jgi:hypothetical protein
MTLNLERQEVDAILGILAERPFREVHQLVAKILQQANEQLAQPQPRAANGEDRPGVQ